MSQFLFFLYYFLKQQAEDEEGDRGTKINIERERRKMKNGGRKNNRGGYATRRYLRCLHWSRLYFERTGIKPQTRFSACFDTIQRFGLYLSLNIRENKLSLPELTTFT